MKYWLGTISLIVLIQSFPLIELTQAQENIPVIKSDYIQKVLETKLMDNFPDGKFYPERLISRAELAGVLVKAFYLDKRQAAKQEKPIFVPDVPSSYWAYEDIQTVLKTDIMKGYRGNMFFPNQRVTRAEGLAIFAQAYGVFQFSEPTVNEILTPYPDAASIPNWARRAIATVITEDLINIDPQGKINPLSPMTRGDLAYVLSKYLQRQQKQPETPIVPGIPQQP
ncbi:S-layer homology domain-containing protein [Anabaena cylindrica FACHB-243]|uniref:S-layer domain-containing protein n=1 Tax=Anabaena cylindrica (strain ATCC 27899 / PCC 7122) TaxID=272123 RepID=K9ZB97_ANACC|nr:MULTISPECIES: S-layer homology domain-containing protein [Anabaena]AFZ56456.1 S-layer domain-containing protein [Anabaena cylindrica PCC 7122]MBD2418094.1 S-layer homology domain-containing protein [Anabaena cylindrica FACHB-243]MBY5281939.1 S-layer homology domain-containing protein [Anabaena sp. CCAP 1446/1C]MBY5310847.1 S-layer homology domain-containing protein [Anabaena sp. CCAP 1446/1C]MCM2407371.1 S-layer homology domain-containing protein [Anabaena sp. CCAP 1446/1C]